MLCSGPGVVIVLEAEAERQLTQVQTDLKDHCPLSVGTTAISAQKQGAPGIVVTLQNLLFWSCLTAGVKVYTPG